MDNCRPEASGRQLRSRKSGLEAHGKVDSFFRRGKLGIQIAAVEVIGYGRAKRRTGIIVVRAGDVGGNLAGILYDGGENGLIVVELVRSSVGGRFLGGSPGGNGAGGGQDGVVEVHVAIAIRHCPALKLVTVVVALADDDHAEFWITPKHGLHSLYGMAMVLIGLTPADH